MVRNHGYVLSLMRYPIAPMMRKPIPTACEILINSLRSATYDMSVSFPNWKQAEEGAAETRDWIEATLQSHRLGKRMIARLSGFVSWLGKIIL